MNSPILNNYVSIILASYLLLGRKFGIIFYLGLTLPLLMHYFDVFRFFGIGQHLAYTPEIKASLIARSVVHTSVLMVMAIIEKIHLELRNDISSRSIKEQKKESELVLTRVASGFAHEINNPLAIIDGYLNMIRLYNSEGKKISTDAFRNIESSIVRINGVVEKFLAIFSQGEPKKEICLLESVIKSSLELEGFENSFIYDFDPHVEILSERRSLTQILNLISKNAFEAVNSDEHIIDKSKAVLKWSVTGPDQLTCIDSGPGFNKISFEDAAKPFVTTNFETSGRGLGLFTVLYICEKLNIKLTYKRLLGRTHICLTFDEPFSISEKSTTKKSA
jgi:nitrogen-specific signal transduction histidine kinase